MSNILYEPSSVRGDCGILYITENEPCNIPFLFEIGSIDNENKSQYYKIADEDIVEFIIKSDIKLITPVIHKKYNNVKNNVAVLTLNDSDIKLLCGGKTYVMSAILHSHTFTRKTLIKQLQIKVQEVV